MSNLISVHGLTMSFPDGSNLFNNFNFNIAIERVGLIGKNGLGKSMLIKNILGEVEPTSGSASVHAKVTYIPQILSDFLSKDVANILNVKEKISALQKAEIGTASIEDLNIINEDWDLKKELELILKQLQLDHLSFDRKGASLSGGELVRLLLARIMIEKPELLILDEPTNNLDFESKKLLFDYIDNAKIGMLVVSHDRELLNKMDRIIEISNLGLKSYGGNFDFYLKERKIEDLAVQNRVHNAEEKFRKQKELAHEVKDKQSHRLAQGQDRGKREGMSALEVGAKRELSQKSTSRLKKVHEGKTSYYLEEVKSAKKKARENYNINIDFEKSTVPNSKKMIVFKNLNYQFEMSLKPLWKENINFEIIGNKRVLISGRNGSGKTTLIKLLMGNLKPTVGEIKLGSNNIAILDQHYTLLDYNLSILENMKRFAPDDMKEHEIRIRVGRFLFYGDDVFKKVSVLSGGERLRVALSCLLAISNSPDILILDEPTNNLDLDSIEILTNSLNSFEGVLIVISHDKYFINDIKIDLEISL